MNLIEVGSVRTGNGGSSLHLRDMTFQKQLLLNEHFWFVLVVSFGFESSAGWEWGNLRCRWSMVDAWVDGWNFSEEGNLPKGLVYLAWSLCLLNDRERRVSRSTGCQSQAGGFVPLCFQSCKATALDLEEAPPAVGGKRGRVADCAGHGLDASRTLGPALEVQGWEIGRGQATFGW